MSTKAAAEPSASASAIKASVSVADPAAGVVWLVGSRQGIVWTASGCDEQHIRLSVDGCKTFTRVGDLNYGSSSPEEYTFPYLVQNTPSNDACIRITVLKNGVQVASGDSGIFTIKALS